MNPVEGFRAYVQGWQQLAKGRNAEFDALLDATERYIDDVLTPVYDKDAEAKKKLDDYWINWKNIFLQPQRQVDAAANAPKLTWAQRALKPLNPLTNRILVNENSMGVARANIDCWLGYTGIGRDTDEFRAVDAASQAFHQKIHHSSRLYTYERIHEVGGQRYVSHHPQVLRRQ